jgi:hypothetical protein
MKLTGYHGTNLQNGNDILRDRVFEDGIRDDEWLGKGVYFFQTYGEITDGLKEAEWWIDLHRINPGIIIQAHINSSKVFDLLDPKDKIYYKNLRNVLLKKHTERQDASTFKEQAVFFKIAFLERNNIEVIRCLVDSNKKDLVYRSYLTLQPQIQICVIRNSWKIISNILKVEDYDAKTV